MAGLLRSRKFWLAVFGVVQTIVLELFNVDPTIWAAIDALVIALITAIAVEDAATKRAGDAPGA